jgi:hypothetical protein
MSWLVFAFQKCIGCFHLLLVIVITIKNGNGTVQYVTVQYVTVQYVTAQCVMVQYVMVQCVTVQCVMVQCVMVQCVTVRYVLHAAVTIKKIVISACRTYCTILVRFPEDEPSGLKRVHFIKIRILVQKWCLLLMYIV